MASFTSFPTPHVAQPIRYSRSLSTAKTSATRGNCAIAYFPPLHAARPIVPETTFPYTYCPRRAEIPAFGKAALPRLFAHTRRIPSFLRQLIRTVKPSATPGIPKSPAKRRYRVLSASRAAQPIVPEATFPYTYCPRRAETPDLRQSSTIASFRAHTQRIPSFQAQLIRSVKPSATHGNAVLRRNSAIELFSTSHVTLSAVLTLPVRVVKLSATRGNSIFLRNSAAALFPAPRNVSSSPRTPLPRAVKTSRRAKFPSPPSRAGFV